MSALSPLDLITKGKTGPKNPVQGPLQPPAPAPTGPMQPVGPTGPMQPVGPITSVRPAQTPPAKPQNLMKMTGPPIPGLVKLGFFGTIQDFNKMVQQQHDAYLIQNGYRPDPNTLMTSVVNGQDNSQRPNLLPPITSADRKSFLTALEDSAKITALQPGENWNTAAHRNFDAFVQTHKDTIDAMLANPKEKGAITTALNRAQTSLTYRGPNPDAPPESLIHLAKSAAETAVRSSWAATQDLTDLGHGLANLEYDTYQRYVMRGNVSSKQMHADVHNVKQAMLFPHLTAVSSALGQIALSLAYSPAGGYTIASGFVGDIAHQVERFSQTTHGKAVPVEPVTLQSMFPRTYKNVQAMNKGWIQDSLHPHNRGGYLFMDFLGLVSVLGGTAERVGAGAGEYEAGVAASGITDPVAAADAIDRYRKQTMVTGIKGGVFKDQAARSVDDVNREGRAVANALRNGQIGIERVPPWLREAALGHNYLSPKAIARGVKGFAAPHALRTFPLTSREGYTEQISLLANNPLFNMLLERAPRLGLRAAQEQLDNPKWFDAVDAFDNTDFMMAGTQDLSFSNRVGETVSGLIGPEARMGRAGNIARQTMAKKYGIYTQMMDDAGGWAMRQSWIDNVLPNNVFAGLSRGEMRALLSASWDLPGDLMDKIVAEERSHQFLIEQSMGNVKYHAQQIGDLQLAKKVAKNPSKRFNEALEAVRFATSRVEEIRAAYGLSSPIAEARVIEAGHFWQLANEGADITDQIRQLHQNYALDAESVDAATTQLRQQLRDIKSAMHRLDIHHVSEDYVPPEFKTTPKMNKNAIALAKANKNLNDLHDAEQAWIDQGKMHVTPTGRRLARDTLEQAQMELAGAEQGMEFFKQGLHSIQEERVPEGIMAAPPEAPAQLQHFEVTGWNSDNEYITEDINVPPDATDDQIQQAAKERGVEQVGEVTAGRMLPPPELPAEAQAALPDITFKVTGAAKKDLEAHKFLTPELRKAVNGEPLTHAEAITLQAKLRELYEHEATRHSGRSPLAKSYGGHSERLQKTIEGNAESAGIDLTAPPEEGVPSEVLKKRASENAKRQQVLQDRIDLAKKNLAEQERLERQGKGPKPVRGNKSPYAERIIKLSAKTEEMEQNLQRLEKAARARHQKQNPPETLARDPGFYYRLGDNWIKVNRNDPGSFYVPMLLRGRSGRQMRGNVRLSGSIFGIGPKKNQIWEQSQMTGRTMILGDFRIDVPTLAGESFSKTARALVSLYAFDKAWQHAREINDLSEKQPHEIYIRDLNGIDYDLRRGVSALYEGRVSAEDAAALPDALYEHLFPENPEPNEHIRVIDERMLGNLFNNEWEQKMAAMEPGVRSFTSPFNNTLRPLILYGPKYALNIVGNYGMLVFDQGFIRSGENLAKAMSLNQWASTPEDALLIKKLAGAGKASSYMGGEGYTKLGAASQYLADFWTRLSDQEFRIASWLYYADRAGFKTPEAIHELLTDEKHSVKLNDVTKRGNDALVSFDRMSPFEKAILRHFIFVYPWQRGALIWSFRSIFEHPAKTDILMHMGMMQQQDDPWLKQAPGWFRRSAYIMFGNDAHSLISTNTFSILGDTAGTLKAWTTGDKYASASDWLGPFGQLGIHAITGVDQQGTPYKGSAIAGAFEDAINMVPVVAGLRRNQKGSGKNLTPFDITQQHGLATTLGSAMRQTTFDPGMFWGFGNALMGGVSGREVHWTALAAKYWHEQDPKLRHEHEVDMLMRQIALQANFLESGTLPSDKEVMDMMLAPLNSVKVRGKVPEDVRKAILDSSQIAYRASIYAKDHQIQSLNPRQQELVTLSYYRDSGRISGSTYKTLLAQAMDPTKSVPSLMKDMSQLNVRYGNTKQLAEWEARVQRLNSIVNKDTGDVNTAARVAVLYQHNLSPQRVYPKMSQWDRETYGRQYSGYTTKVDEMKAYLKSNDLTASQRDAYLNAFAAEHNAPIKIQGIEYPSLSAFDLTSGATSDTQIRLNHLVVKPWYSLNAAEKQIFGRKTDLHVARGWVEFQNYIARDRRAGVSITRDYRDQLAAYVAKGGKDDPSHPGFLQDYQYMNSTSKGERFRSSPIYASVPDREAMDSILNQVIPAAKTLIAGNGDVGATHAAWKRYVAEKIMPDLQKRYPDLYKWVRSQDPNAKYGSPFLTKLITNG